METAPKLAERKLAASPYQTLTEMLVQARRATPMCSQ